MKISKENLHFVPEHKTNQHKNNILTGSFYGLPPITSIKNLYEKVKDEGITLNEVKEFVNN